MPCVAVEEAVLATRTPCGADEALATRTDVAVLPCGTAPVAPAIRMPDVDNGAVAVVYVGRTAADEA